jgi:Flp pilus assembly protein TadB
MVGPGDEIPVRAGGHGHLRASHADREHVIDALKAAYVYGMVTKDEFDARVSQTFAARTHAALALITADIPAGLAAASSPPGPAPARDNAPVHARLSDRAVMATAIFAGLALVAAIFAGPYAALPELVGVVSAFASLFLLAAKMRGSRRNQRSGSQLPPQRGISASQRSRRRISAGQLPYATKPQWRSKADASRSRSPRPQLSS